MSLTIAEKKSSSEGDSGARKERRAECRGFFGGFVAIFPFCEKGLQSILYRGCWFLMTMRKNLTVFWLCGALSEKLFETQKMRSHDFWTVKSMGYLDRKP